MEHTHTYLYISGYLDRSTRDTRKELERFVRVIKKGNPGAQVRLEYDKVRVGDKTYVFDYMEGRVVEKDYYNNVNGNDGLKWNQEVISPPPRNYEVEIISKRQNEIIELENMMEQKDQEIDELRKTILELEQRI